MGEGRGQYICLKARLIEPRPELNQNLYLKARIKSDLLCLYTDLGAWHNLDFIKPKTHGGLGARPGIGYFHVINNVCCTRVSAGKYVQDDDN